MNPIYEVGNYSLWLTGKPSKNGHEYALSYGDVGCIFVFEHNIAILENGTGTGASPSLYRLQDFSTPTTYITIGRTKFIRFAGSDTLAKLTVEELLDECSMEMLIEDCTLEITKWLAENSGGLRFGTHQGSISLDLIGEKVYLDGNELTERG
jgi:hypothetical protein